MVGLGSVDNTADASKPVSTATQTALDLKADKATTYTKTDMDTSLALKADKSTTYTKTDIDAQFAHLIDSAPSALNTLKELATALSNDANYATTVTTQLASKAPLANPTFTGTVSGITKAMVGLEYVDNTADASKPVSTATQLALNAKAPINAPTFTGTVSGITKGMVGLGDVDNTADADKPVSTATNAALALYQPILTVSSPLSLVNNALSITLPSYQQSLSVVAPLTLLNNALSVDLAALVTPSGLTSALTSYLPSNSASQTYQLISKLTSSTSTDSTRYYNTVYVNTQLTAKQDAITTGTYLELYGVNAQILNVQSGFTALGTSTFDAIVTPLVGGATLELRLAYGGTEYYNSDNASTTKAFSFLNAAFPNPTSTFETLQDIYCNGDTYYRRGNITLDSGSITAQNLTATSIVTANTVRATALLQAYVLTVNTSATVTGLFSALGNIDCVGSITSNGLRSSSVTVRNSSGTTTASITQTGAVSCNTLSLSGSSGLMVGNGSVVNAAIDSAGALSCMSLAINGVAYRRYSELVALNSVKTTGINTGSSLVSGWSYTYTGTGGHVKVSVFITCYTNVSATERTWSIYKNSTSVVTGTFFFNNAAVHTAMPVLSYIDYSGTTAAVTWKVYVGAGTNVDSNDTCTMTIAEF